KGAGEKEAIALAAGKRLDRLLRLLLLEEEVPQIADHVPRTPVYDDVIASGRTEHLPGRRLRIEQAALLVHHLDLQVGPKGYPALVRLELPQQQLDQSGLAGPIAAHDTHAIAPADAGRNLPDD